MTRPARIGVTFALAVSFVTCIHAGIGLAPPESVGLSSERLDYVDQFYKDKVARGEMAGIVLLIARHGKVVHFSALGYADVATRQPMRTDTLFRWYSMTKPITAVALMMLYEEGRFELHDPIANYIPEFSGLRVVRTPDSPIDDTVPAAHPPTVEDALCHTAGFGIGLGKGADPVDAKPAELNVYGRDVSLAEMIAKIPRVPLRYQPESRWAYSLSPDVEARWSKYCPECALTSFFRSGSSNRWA